MVKLIILSIFYFFVHFFNEILEMISKRELGEIALKCTNFKDFYERLVKEYSLPKIL